MAWRTRCIIGDKAHVAYKSVAGQTFALEYEVDPLILKDSEFVLFQKMIYETAGINMSDAKKPLVSGRLAKRVKHHGLASYGDYFNLLSSGKGDEFQIAVDLLTTNETFFFREPRHFDFLREQILPGWRGGGKRIWSAASSSGEEAYTLAMVLDEHCPVSGWEVIGTDISSRMIGRAQRGLYPMERGKNIPQDYLKKYCLKGTGSQDGMFLVMRDLRAKVSFIHANLKEDVSRLGIFDLVFLRNVLIYFDLPTKQHVVSRVVRQLKPGGYIMVGHSESLHGVTDALKVVKPAVYQKIA